MLTCSYRLLPWLVTRRVALPAHMFCTSIAHLLWRLSSGASGSSVLVFEKPVFIRKVHMNSQFMRFIQSKNQKASELAYFHALPTPKLTVQHSVTIPQSNCATISELSRPRMHTRMPKVCLKNSSCRSVHKSTSYCCTDKIDSCCPQKRWLLLNPETCFLFLCPQNASYCPQKCELLLKPQQ